MLTLHLTPEEPLVLAGLMEDNPRDFLAALGLLRITSELWTDAGISLAWNNDGHPVMHVRLNLPDDWVALLCASVQALNRIEPHPFVHHKVIKVPQAAMRNHMTRSLEFVKSAGPLHHIPVALYSGFASQIHTDKDGMTNVTAYSFSNGQGGKELLRDVKELINSQMAPASLCGDLLGLPECRRDAKSFRWHPAEFRAAAYRPHDPGAGIKGDVLLDFASANVLAFFGLTFYPVVDRASREETLGLSSERLNRERSDYFTWPIWGQPIGIDAIASLLHHPAVHSAEKNPKVLACLGVKRLRRSRRFSSDKSLYFAPSFSVG